jgi:capsule polysaccharide export protein KpsE/RkpR
MGQYANTVNAFAMSAARAQVYTMQNTCQSYGQTAQQLNVSTAKFRRDIEAKKVKFVAKLQQERVVQLQQELARLTA